MQASPGGVAMSPEVKPPATFACSSEDSFHDFPVPGSCTVSGTLPTCTDWLNSLIGFLAAILNR